MRSLKPAKGGNRRRNKLIPKGSQKVRKKSGNSAPEKMQKIIKSKKKESNWLLYCINSLEPYYGSFKNMAISGSVSTK